MSTILLADPVGTRLMLERTCLMRHPHEIVEARTGSDAVRRARERRPRLILFAGDLVDMDGAAFCAAIRGDATTRETSLLMIVARDSDEAVRRAMAAGANDCLVFPLNRHDLDRKLGIYLHIEPRRDARFLVQARVESARERGFFLGTSVNLSASGMLLEALTDFKIGETVHIRFFLPGVPREIEAQARIVRSEVRPGVRQYGLHFDAIRPEHAECIRTFAVPDGAPEA
jgi:CheY-like chemotaxis protein